MTNGIVGFLEREQLIRVLSQSRIRTRLIKDLQRREIREAKGGTRHFYLRSVSRHETADHETRDQSRFRNETEQNSSLTFS